MGFDLEEVSKRFPAYLSDTDKGRLRDVLNDFVQVGAPIVESKLYSQFYLRDLPDYLLQADVIDGIRMPAWDADRGSSTYASFKKEYVRALMISNTCDVDLVEKDRLLPKQVSFVPVVPLKDYIDSIDTDRRLQNRKEQAVKDIKSQQYSNLFFLPKGKGFEEHVALLDQPFWFPSSELTEIIEAVISHRIISLSQWAYYLFILKLSYHLCRLPEAPDR